MAEFVGLCVVSWAGPTDGGISIRLEQPEGGSFPMHAFWARPDRENEMLAVALAAMTAKRKVIAAIKDGQVREGGTITALYFTYEPAF